MDRIVVDCSTGEEVVVPLSPEEIAARAADAAVWEADEETRAALPTDAERIADLTERLDRVAPPVQNDGDIDPEHASDDPLAAEVARLSSLLEAVLADPEIAKVADIEAIRTAAEGSKDDDALVLAVAKVLGADPAEVRKKRDENPQWFADMVTSTGSAT